MHLIALIEDSPAEAELIQEYCKRFCAENSGLEQKVHGFHLISPDGVARHAGDKNKSVMEALNDYLGGSV